jgi:hypothetical protein
MAHYPYIDLSGSAGGCTTELTQIAAGSTNFTQDTNYLSSDEYYIGTTDQGWAGCSLDIINKPGSDQLLINNSNCAIQLPIDVNPGDKIKICGIASGLDDNQFTNGSFFGIALNVLECGNRNETEWNQINVLKEDFTFVDNHVCWSAEYVVQGGKGCSTMFTLGFGTEESRVCKLTWTFNLETTCVGPCEFEHTNVAANGIKFNADNSFNSGEWYGFSDKCGWRGPGNQWVDLSSNVLPKSFGFNGIKLPVNLIPGDVIRICGLATGVDNNPFTNDSKFACKLQYALCSEAETVDDKDWPTYNLTENEYAFSANGLCFSLDYVIPAGSPLLACNTMLLAGFGTDETGKDCLVSYSLNVRKPCGSCTSEYTPIAHTSGNFYQKKIDGKPLYYVGEENCGWSGCSYNIVQEITREEISQPLSINFTNCAIKLPFDLVQGDKITICGTTTGEAGIEGTGFFTALTKFTCSDYDDANNEWVVSTGLNFSSFTFNHETSSCWSLEYVVPVEGMLACDTNLMFGIKCQLDNLAYTFSWTMDIVKLCPGPQEVGCCFTHAKTLFVDPNGNDLTALEGKQTKPWKTIAAAVEYLADNTRTGYTIEVFPGEYLNEPVWLFDFKNTDTTIKLNGNVNIGGATTIPASKGLIQVDTAKLKIVGDDRTNSTFAYGGPGAYIQGNSGPDAIIYSLGTTDISVSNVSMNNTASSPPGIFYEGNTNGGKLTLNEVSLLSIRENIRISSCERPPVINIKDSVLYVGSDDSTIGYENIKLESVQGGYNPATWIFIENSRLVINGFLNDADSHITSDCFNSSSIRGVFNGVLFYWKWEGNLYIWRDGSGQNIDVEIINPVVTNHDSWVGSSSFNMVTGFGLHVNKGLLNPSLYDG